MKQSTVARNVEILIFCGIDSNVFGRYAIFLHSDLILSLQLKS